MPSATAQAVATQTSPSLAPATAADQWGRRSDDLAGPRTDPAQIRDVAIKASFNNTYEIGYKGIIGNKLRLTIDAWSEKRGDVGNPAGLTTPNIFFNKASLQAYMGAALVPAITAALMGPPFNMSQAQAAGTAAAFAPQIASTVATNFAPLPLGIISFNSETFASARDIYATYTSYDATVTVKGIDLAVDYVANDNWTLGGTLSWVDNDSFPEVTSSNSRPLMLNAPSMSSRRFRSTDGAWGLDSADDTNAYPVYSGVFASDVVFPAPAPRARTHTNPSMRPPSLM